MDAYMWAIIAMMVLAVVVLGSVLLMRSGRNRSAELPAGEGSMAFKDCYDLAAYGSGRDTPRSFTSMCSNYPGA